MNATDEKQLREYEPVLRFAHNERFFPVKVEDYLARCRLLKTRRFLPAKGVTEETGKPLAEALGDYKGSNYYLRFVKPDLDSSFWLGFVVLLVVGVLLGWAFAGLDGVWTAAKIAIGLLVIVYLGTSEVRRQVLFGILISGLFLWLISRPIAGQWNIPTWLMICGLPLYFLLAVATLMVVGQTILRDVFAKAPGLVMDTLSSATDATAEGAYEAYKEILQGAKRPIYYGRVVKHKEGQDAWTVLQYHYFYAFNDWRLAADGMNHHEGDWEMVAIFLKNDDPYGVAYSQHHDGAFKYWRDVKRVRNADGTPSSHPLIYAALGSHANYPTAVVKSAPELFQPDFRQQVIYWIDWFLRHSFRLMQPKQTDRRQKIGEMLQRFPTPRAYTAIEAQRDSDGSSEEIEARLPTEFATGDRIRIGFIGDSQKEDCEEATIDLSDYLPAEKLERETTAPQELEWQLEPLDPLPGWVAYLGLWGVRSLLSDESGPPGPKWNRVKNGATQPQPRLRWADPPDSLGWMKKLEENLKEERVLTSDTEKER